MAENSQSLNISFKWLSAVLALLVVGLLIYIGVSQPWNTTADGDRETIEARGEAKVEAEPDEFLFYPYWEVDAANEDDLTEQIRVVNNDSIAAIKNLGVLDQDITNNANSFEGWYYPNDQPDTLRANVYLEFTTADRDVAQRVIDYLIDNQARGQLTPQSQFSDELRKELESEARELAIADAKSKAEQLANGFGQKLGGLKKVQTNDDFGSPFPAVFEGRAEDSASSGEPLTFQPGQNEITYTINAEFYIE